MSQAIASWVDFKEVKARVSIVQVLERYGAIQTLAKSGNGDRLSGACPIHGGSNKTHFRVSVSKNCWNCFGKCQCGGNVIDFVARKEGIPFREAALLLKDWFLDREDSSSASETAPRDASCHLGLDRLNPIIQKSNESAPDDASESEGAKENAPLSFELSSLDPSHPYLRERGLSEETIAAFGLGHCSKGLLRGYVAIPIHTAEGALVAYAGRLAEAKGKTKKAKYKLPKGFRKSLELFNCHRAAACQQVSPLVVVEGFFDAMRLHQAGYHRVVAIMGSSLSERQEESICALCKDDRRVILFFDNDEAGKAGQSEALRRLATRLFVRAIGLRDGIAQPEEVEPEELRSLLPFPERKTP